jgi:hypothetical protein
MNTFDGSFGFPSCAVDHFHAHRQHITTYEWEHIMSNKIRIARLSRQNLCTGFKFSEGVKVEE